MATTTVSTSNLIYFIKPHDGDTFSATSEPTSTAVTAMITRASNYINELFPNATQNMHDEAVYQIAEDYVKNYNKNYLGAGSESAQGEKSGSFSWQPDYRMIRKQTLANLHRSEKKSKPRISVHRGMSW